MRLWMLLLCLWICASAHPSDWAERVHSVIRASWDELTSRVGNGDRDRELFRRLLAGSQPISSRLATFDEWLEHYPVVKAKSSTVKPWFELLNHHLHPLDGTKLNRVGKTRIRDLFFRALAEHGNPREAFGMVDHYLNLLSWRHVPEFASAHTLARQLPPELLPPQAHFRYDLLHRAAIDATELPQPFVSNPSPDLSVAEILESRRLGRIRFELENILRNMLREGEQAEDAAELYRRFQQAYSDLQTTSEPEDEWHRLDGRVVKALIDSEVGVSQCHARFDDYVKAVKRELKAQALPAGPSTSSVRRVRLFGADVPAPFKQER